MRVSRPSSRLSFDDLIDLRFLPSRRRHRDLEYLEQLKSMIMRREVNYRVVAAALSMAAHEVARDQCM